MKFKVLQAVELLPDNTCWIRWHIVTLFRINEEL